jgi:ribosomal protein L9
VRIPIPDTTSTFGSVTNEDIVEKLKEHGISVDKKAILSDKIKNLGRHDITIKCGETDISIGVNITAA